MSHRKSLLEHCRGAWRSKTGIRLTGRSSSIGSEFAWHASGPEFDPHVRHILSWKHFYGHSRSSSDSRKAVVSYWRKECALSTGKLPRRLAQKQCG